MATRALVSSSALTSSVEAARQTLGGRSLQTSSKKVSFFVKAAATPPVKQGANRPLWFASKQSLSYLDGSLPGDFGFDPLGLSDPEGTGGFIEPKWLAYGEIINGRFAMLGAAGAIAPEILGKLGLIPAETALPWFQTGVIPPAGTYSYWADPFTLFVLEMALMGFGVLQSTEDSRTGITPGQWESNTSWGITLYPKKVILLGARERIFRVRQPSVPRWPIL